MIIQECDRASLGTVYVHLANEAVQLMHVTGAKRTSTLSRQFARVTAKASMYTVSKYKQRKCIGEIDDVRGGLLYRGGIYCLYKSFPADEST